MAEDVTGRPQAKGNPEPETRPGRTEARAKRAGPAEITRQVADLINQGMQAGEGSGEPSEDEEPKVPPSKHHRRRDPDEQERDDGDEEGEQHAESEEADHEGESTTIDDVAKALGLSGKELNEVQIWVNKEQMTLGELKEALPKVAKLESERAEFEDRKQAAELELIDGKRRIMALVDAIPQDSLPPGLLRQLQAQHREQVTRESELLHQARPQWREANYSQAEREAMLKVASKYGFTAVDVASIMDHRAVLLLQDFAHALARIEAAKQGARRVEPGSDKPLSKETTRAGTNGARPAGTGKREHLARRVAELIARGR